MWNAGLSTWKEHVENYESAIAAKSGSDENSLSDLEKFAWDELPTSINARDPPHMTADEYQRLVGWKLLRGKWRPRLQSFANALTDKDIKSASEKAFSLLRENAGVVKALGPLIDLRGCGPATASAVLAIVDDSIPFMADELLEEAIEGKRTYTKKVYATLVEKTREKASELSNLDDEKTWTAKDVERAVYASRHFDSATMKKVVTVDSVSKGEQVSTGDKSSSPVVVEEVEEVKPVEKRSLETVKKSVTRATSRKRRKLSDQEPTNEGETEERRVRPRKEEKEKSEAKVPAKRTRRGRK